MSVLVFHQKICLKVIESHFFKNWGLTIFKHCLQVKNIKMHIFSGIFLFFRSNLPMKMCMDFHKILHGGKYID